MSGGTVTYMITLTATAVRKVAELLSHEAEPDMALRVAVRPGGCSGFSYEMFFDADIVDEDERSMYTYADTTVMVVVDPASKQLLDGAELDYKDGLNQAGFAVTNPNATRTCGCGQSWDAATT